MKTGLDECTARQDGWGSSEPTEDVNTLGETKGCAILDVGATVMCSSAVAAEEIQGQRLRQNEPGPPSVRESDCRFCFADGRTDEVQDMVELPIAPGSLKGKSINTHLIDRACNETSPLVIIDDKRRHFMVGDYEETKSCSKTSRMSGTHFQPPEIGLTMTSLQSPHAFLIHHLRLG